MPDTLFNMIKNRQVRPNTPFLWTYARDETFGMTSSWIIGRAKNGQPLAHLKQEIKARDLWTARSWSEKLFGPEADRTT